MRPVCSRAMTTLFLIRHGLTAVTGSRLYGRTPGIHLDERGRRQAAALVERFEGVRLTAIYSSPLERCVETLEPLAAARGARHAGDAVAGGEHFAYRALPDDACGSGDHDLVHARLTRYPARS